MADNMKTTNYHTFLPTKAQEEEAKKANNPGIEKDAFKLKSESVHRNHLYWSLAIQSNNTTTNKDLLVPRCFVVKIVAISLRIKGLV
ncbi:unnamed protein product [Prunus armeniaca]|uniref:Uncharacterized protein n=1 Tax=Prunus armeniaca TaxID=36596 RepID=A0A6J5XK61_PRUAR|nr:unnamed protein product [Prunus armeniaca]